MNSIAILFLLLNSLLLLSLPRRWATFPLLICACYMTYGQSIDLGPFSFTIIRILVVVGFLRIFIRRERLLTGFISLDYIIICWGIWAILSSFFHEDPTSALIFRLGLVFNICGIYFLIRFFCQSIDDIILIYKMIVIILVVLSFEMICEKFTTHNWFSIFGGVSPIPSIREGRIRAQGPFGHSILAGTVGSVSLPFMIGLLRFNKKLALIGILSCSAMIITSSSSSPILSCFAGIMGLFLWKFRHRMRLVRCCALLGYILLDLVMKAPPYYLMARVDVAGGSTGYHRARLIQSAIQHLPEWWFAGTDYTRHWMVTGVSWSASQTDITNYYLKMGVWGGLPLMLLFIALMILSFFLVGDSLKKITDMSEDSKFIIWTLSASLFAHAATFLAVSYFDQSFLFIYFDIAAIGSIWSFAKNHRENI